MSEEDIEFQRVFTEGLVPQMKNSTVCVSLCPTSEERLDAKFCTELGAMIMLDKPILAIVGPGSPVPPKLELVADKIVHADITTEEGHALLMEALTDFGITPQDLDDAVDG